MSRDWFGSLYQVRQQALMSRRPARRAPVTTVEACTGPASLDDVLPDGRCERCYEPWVKGQHGLGVCPVEPREERFNLCHRDKLFEFTTVHRAPGTEIRTKGQFKRFLDKQGLTDDLTIKERITRRTSGLAQRKSKERRDRLKQRAQPVIAKALRESRSIRVANG